MTVYVIIAMPNSTSSSLNDKIERSFAENYKRLTNDTWLLAGRGSAKTISEQLGITGGGNSGSAVVVAVDNYFGRASKDIWDWIKEKWEATDE